MRFSRLWIAVAFAGSLSAQVDRQKEKEAALGAMVAREILRSSRTIDSAPTLAYIEEIGRRLAAQMPPNPYQFTFHLIAEDRAKATHEPLWAPAGHVFVPSALILAARSEAEFAGMLAHAMVHSAERHALTQRSSINDQSIPLVFMGPVDGHMAMPKAWQAAYGQWQAEAGRRAVHITYDAGYDPAGLTSYLRRAGEDARAAAIEESIRNLPLKTFAPSDGLSQAQEELRSKLPPPPVERVPTLRRPSDQGR